VAIFFECCYKRRGQALKERLSGTTKKFTTSGKDVIYPFVS
jgi:hypothetical protein